MLLVPHIVEPPPERAQVGLRHEGRKRLADEELPRQAQHLRRGQVGLTDGAARVGDEIAVGPLLEESPVLGESGLGGVPLGFRGRQGALLGSHRGREPGEGLG